MIGAVVVALAIGLWPVQANVFGDPTYSCGSGFIHNTKDWNVDSTTLQNQRTATDNATGLPASICPDKVDSRRDLALLLMAFSLAIGMLYALVANRSGERNFRSTMYANRRRGPVRSSMPVRRAAPEDTASP